MVSIRQVALCITGGALLVAAAFFAPVLALWDQGNIYIDFGAACMAGTGLAIILKNAPPS